MDAHWYSVATTLDLGDLGKSWRTGIQYKSTKQLHKYNECCFPTFLENLLLA